MSHRIRATMPGRRSFSSTPMAVTGGDSTRVLPVSVAWPSRSPDGTRIAYAEIVRSAPRNGDEYGSGSRLPPRRNRARADCRPWHGTCVVPDRTNDRVPGSLRRSAVQEHPARRGPPRHPGPRSFRTPGCVHRMLRGRRGRATHLVSRRNQDRDGDPGRRLHDDRRREAAHPAQRQGPDQHRRQPSVWSRPSWQPR